MRKNKKLVATYGDLQEEGKLQRPPKGFDPDTPNIEYVKLKSFIVWTEEDIRKKIPADLESRCWKASRMPIRWCNGCAKFRW
jgi:uncharacterized protein (DUF2461 family)